jgi:hypothetical protein
MALANGPQPTNGAAPRASVPQGFRILGRLPPAASTAACSYTHFFFGHNDEEKT